MSTAFPARRLTPPPPPPPTRTGFDTGALLTLAVDDGLWNLAVSRFRGTAFVPVAVMSELQHLQSDSRVGQLGRSVLADADWLGEPITIDDDRRTEVAALRDIIAGARPLFHPLQHYGEATLIVLGQSMGAQALIEDYDARIAAFQRGVLPLSVHRLLHLWIKRGVLTPQQAFLYSESVRAAGRGKSYTEEELAEGGRFLGRVWEP